MIKIKQVYRSSSPQDGYRVFVDKIWPRGVHMEIAKIDEWLKDAAPSDELRRWFEYDSERWLEFKERYGRELECKTELLKRFKAKTRGKDVALLFTAKDEEHNNAVVLKGFLESLK